MISPTADEKGLRSPPTIMRRVASVAAVVVACALVWLVPGAENDFVYDWLTARAYVSGVDPYRPLGDLAEAAGLATSQALDLIHARTPGALLVQAPIGFIPYGISYEAGRLLTVASAFFMAWVLARIAGFPLWVAISATPIILVLWPFSRVLVFSQTGFLIAALIGFTWLLGDRWYSGFPLAVAVTLKLWPWLLVPALYLCGRKRAALGATSAFLVLTLVGMIPRHMGIAGVRAMIADAASFRTVSPASELGLPIWVAAAVGLALVWLLSRRLSPPAVYAWSIAIALLVAPFIWVHYLPVLLVPAVLLKSGSSSSMMDGSNGREATVTPP